MRASFPTLAVLVLCVDLAVAGVEDADKGVTRARDDRPCAGVANESTKMRELRRELGAYIGQTIPDDLQRRINKHVESVAKFKAECDQRDKAALAK